jgi:hypothetical protein
MNHNITDNKKPLRSIFQRWVTSRPTIIPGLRLTVSTLVIALLAVTATIAPTAQAIDRSTLMPDGGGSTTTAPDEEEYAPYFRGDLESSQWYFDAIGVREVNLTGDDVTVAVLSDGVWAQHPDLQGSVLDGYDAVTGKSISAGTPLPIDAVNAFTGTYLAAIIAGSADKAGIRGIAPGARILPVNVDTKFGTEDRYVAAGIDWAVENGADIIVVATAASAYFAETDEKMTCVSIAAARAVGVATFTASGNNSRDEDTTYLPARCESVIPIAALSATLGPIDGIVNDVTPIVAAPGVNIGSASTEQSYLPYVTGDIETAATAQAAAVAALILEKEPDLDVDTLVDRLRKSATDLGAIGPDTTSGYGILDAAAATGLRERRTEQMLQAVISNSSTARIVSMLRDDAGKTAVSWEPPTGAKVNDYEIVVTSWEEGRWFDQTYTAEGSAVRILLPEGLPTESFVRVIAVTETGNRSGFPSAAVTYANYEPTVDPDAAVVELTSTWVAEGLRVDIVTNQAGEGALWNVAVLDGWTRQPVKSERQLRGTSRVLYFGKDSEYREMPVYLFVWIGTNNTSKLVWPEFSLDAEGYAAGKNHAAVSGSASFACVEDRRSACEGTELTIIDSKTKKVLATAIVLSDQTFSAVFPWKPINLQVQVIGADGVISKPIDKTLTWRK